MNDVADTDTIQDVDQAEASIKTMSVVGVGVSAASLRSLEIMFAAIGPGLDAAYLIAVRQQEGLEVGAVVDALRRQSPLPVTIGEDGERIEANHIYVGGRDDMMTLEGGHLRVTPATEPVGHRATFDSMLVSIAEHAHDNAVAVILNGLGIDGTAGVTATKKFGGLSIGEADAENGAGSSQGAAGPLGAVDVHLPADEIPTRIALYLGSATGLEDGSPDSTAEAIEARIAQITTIVRNTTGHDFHGYKRGTLLRRVHRRLQVLQIDSIGAYVTRLRDDRQEVKDLFQDLLIGVTEFFRDSPEFDVLEREIPRLFEGKTRGDQFRVWVLGCATGEEAYSIAILLREHMATLAEPPHVQIFATDLDARALGLARAARYSAAIANQIRPDRLERWFVREGDTYCVSKELREMCIFSPHNVVKDAPFSRIDILSCRNLLIYLNVDIQNRVIPIFHFSLRPAGVLFLGSSEKRQPPPEAVRADRPAQPRVPAPGNGDARHPGLPAEHARARGRSGGRGGGRRSPAATAVPDAEPAGRGDRRALRPGLFRGRHPVRRAALLRAHRPVPGAGGGCRDAQPVQPDPPRPAHRPALGAAPRFDREPARRDPEPRAPPGGPGDHAQPDRRAGRHG